MALYPSHHGDRSMGEPCGHSKKQCAVVNLVVLAINVLSLSLYKLLNTNCIMNIVQPVPRRMIYDVCRLPADCTEHYEVHRCIPISYRSF